MESLRSLTAGSFSGQPKAAHAAPYINNVKALSFAGRPTGAWTSAHFTKPKQLGRIFLDLLALRR